MTSRHDDADAHGVDVDGALLWLLHALLRARWSFDAPTIDCYSDFTHRQQPWSPLELRAFAGNVNVLPAVVYHLTPADAQCSVGDPEQQHAAAAELRVEVRAIRVQQKLFVHFVAARKSLRLDLAVREYVSAANSSGKVGTDASDRVARVGNWLCRQELLQWRLERSVFAEFASAAPRVVLAAELARLSEPLTTRVFTFLCAPEFVRAAQANKSMHHVANNPALWRTFLRQDFPQAADSVDAARARDAKAAYIAQHRDKLQRDRARREMRRLEHLAHRVWASNRCGFFPPHLAQPAPLWLPPPPFHPALPGEPGRSGRRRQWGPFGHDAFDTDLRLAFE